MLEGLTEEKQKLVDIIAVIQESFRKEEVPQKESTQTGEGLADKLRAGGIPNEAIPAMGAMVAGQGVPTDHIAHNHGPLQPTLSSSYLSKQRVGVAAAS